jgi:hypothetical protein
VSRKITPTASCAHGTILLVVYGDLIWACCALASDKACGSEQDLEEETCHGVVNLSGGWLVEESFSCGIGMLYTKVRSFLGSPSYLGWLTYAVYHNVDFCKPVNALFLSLIMAPKANRAAWTLRSTGSSRLLTCGDVHRRSCLLR